MLMQQDGVGGVRKSMDEDAIEYEKMVEVMSGQGNQISRVDRSKSKPHTEPLISHLKGTLGLNGEIEGGTASILLDSGTRLTSFLEDIE